MWGSSLANVALFALFFPSVCFLLHIISSVLADIDRTVQYIIMAMYARPVPLDPYNPSSSIRGANGNDDTIRYPSPLIPIRIPVFAPVIFLNDWIVRILSVGTGGRASAAYTGSSGQSGGRHRRIPSDSVESIEEGEPVEMDTMSVRSALSDAGRARVRIPGPTALTGRTGRKFD